MTMCDSEIFITSSNHSASERVAFILTHDPTGSRQFKKCSHHSTRCILNTDTIVRAIFFPHMATKESPVDLHDAIFEDAFNKGGSAQNLVQQPDQIRNIHATNERVAEARRNGTDGRPAQAARQYMGLVYMRVENIREAEPSHKIRVYDSGITEDDPHHADIVVNSEGLTKEQKKLIRVKLLKIAIEHGLERSPALSEEHRDSISHIKNYTQNSSGANILNLVQIPIATSI